MRNKEIEEAIKSCNLLLFGDIQLHIIDDDGGTAYEGTVDKLYNKDLETVLSYISELEEKVEKYNKQLDLDYVDNNFVSKAKIKELKEIYERKCAVLKPNCARIEWYEMGKNFGRADALEELLGEENDN